MHEASLYTLFLYAARCTVSSGYYLRDYNHVNVILFHWRANVVVCFLHVTSIPFFVGL